jgi:methyltransferase (TIGR00027 family)
MKANRHSSTAEATAAVRAWHTIHHEPRILEDPYAIELTSGMWRLICRSRLLSWLVFGLALKRLLPIAAEIICRSRYTEDKLESAIRDGVQQYVLLGAGFDSYALRRPPIGEAVRLFELDHPLSQRTKKERLGKHYDRLSNSVEFVPVDFEEQTLAEVLQSCGYDPEQRAFFAWLGVVQYLAPGAVRSSLQDLAACTASGSELVFDYLLPASELTPADRPILEGLQRFTQRRGEPLASYFTPSELATMADECGFDVVENFSPSDQAAAYFQEGNHDLMPFSGYHIIHLRRR